MKPFRVSIATLAVCVLIVALNLSILRSFPGGDRAWLDLFALPMLNILAFAFYRGHSLRRRGMSGPFLRGFQVFGWAALTFYLLWCRIRPQGTAWVLALAFERVHWLTLNNLDFESMKRLDPSFGLAWRISKAMQGVAAAAFVTGVMLLPATLGGFIGRHLHRHDGHRCHPPMHTPPDP